MLEYDPHQLRSSVIAYRNLPDVDSVEDCYYLMKRVSIGLGDIVRYLNHTISSLESTYAALKLEQVNRGVSSYILDNCKDATWVRAISTESDERNSWKKSFREGVQVLSPTKVRDSIPYRERIPRDMPRELRKMLLTNGDEWSFLGYPIEVFDYHESQNMILLSSLPEVVFNKRKKPFWLLYIPSTYQWRRYREALHNFINEPSKNLQPLLNLFQRTEYVSWPNVPKPRVKESDWLFLTDPENPSTKKQRLFVRRALATPELPYYGALQAPARPSP